MKIHAAGVVTEGDVDFESVVKMSDGLNGADLRNVVTEAYVLPLLYMSSHTNVVPVDCLQLRITEMQSTKMTSTKQYVRWQSRRSWRGNWNIKNSKFSRSLLASALWHTPGWDMKFCNNTLWYP